MVNTANNTSYNGGVRQNGSAVVQARGGGDSISMCVKADENSIIECYAEDTTDVVFYLVGWWSK